MPASPTTRRDLVAFGVLAAGLLIWFAGPGVARGFTFPVGPDAPVYLWWTRLVGVEGLSAVTRPGVPALALVLSGTLHAPASAVLAALEIAGGIATGVAGAALVRVARPDDRPTWILAGALVGTFAVHVATGYLATLVFGVVFLAVGAAILIVAAALAWRDDRDDARRFLAVVAGGAAILALVGLALLLGPSPLLVDTSRDAFLRRVGLGDVLERAYRERFLARWTRYAPWGILPLAAVGVGVEFRGARGRSTVERILAAWVVVAAGGAVVAFATGLLPIDRFVTFAFAMPLLAALGAVRLARTVGGPRVVGRLAAAALVGAMLFGAGASWLRQEPFLDDRDLAALRVANAVAVAAPGRALVAPVGSEQSAFLLTLSGNAIRATVPPGRIRDVVVTAVGSAPGREGVAIGARTAADVRAATAARGGPAQRILVVPFAEREARGAPWTLVADDVAVDPVPEGFAPSSVVEPVEPYAPWLPTAIAIAALALLGAGGWAWTRIAGIADVPGTVALAPAVGMGFAILVAFPLERIGLPLTGSVGPLVASAVAVGSGPLARRVLARRERIARDREPRA
ncbi:MAG: hypothetical protein ACKOKE_01430 [Actinomycetota bacterium]